MLVDRVGVTAHRYIPLVASGCPVRERVRQRIRQTFGNRRGRAGISDKQDRRWLVWHRLRLPPLQEAKRLAPSTPEPATRSHPQNRGGLRPVVPGIPDRDTRRTRRSTMSAATTRRRLRECLDDVDFPADKATLLAAA